MVEFRRDPETGEMIAYQDGTEVGPVLGMGDLTDDENDVEAEGI